MPKKTAYIAIVVALILGLIVGYGIADKKSRYGSHRMPDGKMMMGDKHQSMESMMADMNKELMGKTGRAFDQAFLKEMIVHHQGAVEMARMALVNAEKQELKDLAQAIITAQEKEIAMMQEWQKAWATQ